MQERRALFFGYLLFFQSGQLMIAFNDCELMIYMSIFQHTFTGTKSTEGTIKKV